MDRTAVLALLLLAAHWIAAISLSIRVILLQRSIGAVVSWIILMFSLPYVGVFAYLLFGERRVGTDREKRYQQLQEIYRELIDPAMLQAPDTVQQLKPAFQGLSRQAVSSIGLPALGGNKWHLLDNAEDILNAIVDDIDRACTTCYLEFYIVTDSGEVVRVWQALERAAARGVECGVLADSVGSRPFFKSATARSLRAAGVEIVEMLSVGLFKTLFVRADLRNHRKIVTIDGEIAYTGSFNLVDPRTFKKDAGVGEWVDVMIRIDGPAAMTLEAVLLGDWVLENEVVLQRLHDRPPATPHAAHPISGTTMQTAPTGPGQAPDAIYELLLTAIYSASNELVITTPYFVPDESLLVALITAAHRGVDVVIVVPAKVDSLLVRHASQSHYERLLTGGVKIAAFRGGLLHSKTITIDNEISLVGTVNIDPRSFALNQEITLLVYERDFTQTLRTLQYEYLRSANYLNSVDWINQPRWQKLFNNSIRLVSPLL